LGDVKRLIVNGDDFGASHGINRGIIEAHRMGILTSASMMVDGPASAGAASLAAESPGLGLGLHAVVEPTADTASLRTDLERQLEHFVSLTGRCPTHVDSHHHVHRNASALPTYLAFAERYALPLRGFCGVRHIASFYGQWAGETHLEQVGVPALAEILATEVDDGFNELCCHPGYADRHLPSSYRLERQAELETLRDPSLPELIRERHITLATFRELTQP
jgi:chitin disaccharide deacetylase